MEQPERGRRSHGPLKGKHEKIAFFFEEFDFIILDEEKRRGKVNANVRRLYTGEDGEHFDGEPVFRRWNGEGRNRVT